MSPSARLHSAGLAVLVSFFGACSGSTNGDSPAASGGQVGTSSGGAVTSGGALTSGGASTSGGAATSGGASSSGGATSAGTSAGGATAQGGATSAGAGSGGATGQAGATTQGGATTGGATAQGGATSAGAGSGGATGKGGASSGGATSGGASSGGAAGGNAGKGGGGGATAQGGGAPQAGTTGMPDPNNGANGSDKPMGFAAIAGAGLDTTTGGSGGMKVTVTTFDQLAELLDSDTPAILLISGSIDLQGGMVPMRSNKTLIGLAGAKLHNGGLEMNKRQNIIVRNIIFADGTDDTFKINQNTHHIWVDHCDFTNAADGLFDITRQSGNITISWNHFYKHSKTMLIGHSDSQTDDTGYLKTTIHHNYFDGTEQRHPRVRFGEVHVFNNYFLANALYGVASTMDAKVVVEGNFFQDVAHPTHSGYQESGPGDLVERNNAYVNSGVPETRGTAFDPKTYYPYVVENPSTLPEMIKSKAGVGVIDPMAAAK